MKNNRRNIKIGLAAALVALALTACEKVIIFEGDETDSEPVMVSQPEVGKPWKARLSMSQFFLSNDTIATVKDAQIKAVVNGRELNSLVTYTDNGIYDIGYTPQEGDSLELHVALGDGKKLSAGCRMPRMPIIALGDCTRDTIEGGYYDARDSTNHTMTGNVSLKITIDDPADEKNYYMVRFAHMYSNVDSNWYYTSFCINDEVLFDIDVTEDVFDLGFSEVAYCGEWVAFTDDRINGKKHTFEIDDRIYEVRALKVEVYGISRDLYLYMRTLKSLNEQDDYNGIFSEPVQLHSNVEGGIGVLGGKSMATVEIRPEDVRTK